MSLRPTASEFVPRMRPTASEFVPRMRPYSDESAARNIQRRFEEDKHESV